jgi:hypothetical protein
MVKRLTELFERLAAELPPGTASVNVYDVQGGQGTVVELRPANPACADFGVHAEDRSDIVEEKDVITEIEETFTLASTHTSSQTCRCSNSAVWNAALFALCQPVSVRTNVTVDRPPVTAKRNRKLRQIERGVSQFRDGLRGCVVVRANGDHVGFFADNFPG